MASPMHDIQYSQETELLIYQLKIFIQSKKQTITTQIIQLLSGIPIRSLTRNKFTFTLYLPLECKLICRPQSPIPNNLNDSSANTHQ